VAEILQFKKKSFRNSKISETDEVLKARSVAEIRKLDFKFG